MKRYFNQLFNGEDKGKVVENLNIYWSTTDQIFYLNVGHVL